MFHLLFRIVFLPFVLIGALFRLLGISTRIFLIPLKIFARHTALCLVLIAAVILYLAVKSDPHSVDSLKPPPPKENKAAAAPKGQPPVVETVGKREDGDSVFATDLYVSMTDDERAYYSSVFYKVMDATPDGSSSNWSYYNVHGVITPTRSFTNNSGVSCRTFSETLKVHRIEQTLTGTACRKENGGWCKLKPNATPACNLGYSPGLFDGITNAVKNLF
jgi:surface antigen